MISLGGKPFALCCNFLFCLLTGCVSGETIITTVGTDVTLRCRYDARYYGRLPVCWGRGSIPNSGCANQVLKSDGTSVISRLSERYLLLGNLGHGDVSLTIRQVDESDSGTYGCRVEIPGWFNDQKQELTLTVKAGRPFPMTIKPGEVKQRTISVRWTPPFNGGAPIAAFIIDLKNKQEPWDSAVRTTLSHAQLTRATLVDLRPTKTYNIRMFAVNSVGMSEGSNVLTLTTEEAAPEGPPLDMQLEALSSDSIRVTWKPPRADLINGGLRSYRVTYREYDAVAQHFEKWQAISVKAMHEVESVILRNLKPSTEYGVLVQAITNGGTGPASTAPLCSTLDEIHETITAATTAPFPSSTTTWMKHMSRPSQTLPHIHTTSATETTFAAIWWEQTTTGTMSVPPDPPVVELQEVTDNIISLLWIPGFEGDSPITGYFLEYKEVNASWDYTKTVVDFGSNQTDATIIEIRPSTYNLRMFAMNSLGISKASNILTVTTGETGQQTNTIASMSADTQTAVTEEDGQGVHPAAIIVPVVLVVLIGAMVTTWQFQRIKRNKGSLNIWLRYKGSESLQEL